MSAETSAGSLVVVRAWSRATVPGVPVGVAYFEIVNSGGKDALLHIKTSVARDVEMHSMATVGGLMQMRRVLSVDVPARGRVRFEPNGLHAMLLDLVRPLNRGDHFELTLAFQHAGQLRGDVRPRAKQLARGGVAKRVTWSCRAIRGRWSRRDRLQITSGGSLTEHWVMGRQGSKWTTGHYPPPTVAKCAIGVSRRSRGRSSHQEITVRLVLAS
jgi:copper(I)-binding protein